MPSSIHARLRFSPSRCASFGSVGSVTTAGSSHPAEPSAGICGRNARSHSAIRGRREHAAHEVRLGDARREEILAVRLVVQRARPIVAVELRRLRRDEVDHRLVAGRARPVEHEAEGEGRLIVLADPDRARELRQPLREARGGGGLERAHHRGPLPRLRVLPLPQLGRELQQPRQAVGPLEAGAARVRPCSAPRPRRCSAVRLRARAARARGANGASGNSRARRARSQCPCTDECQS